MIRSFPFLPLPGPPLDIPTLTHKDGNFWLQAYLSVVIDPVTGLGQRNLLCALLEYHYETFLDCTLCLVDINHFGRLMEQHPHQTLNPLLCALRDSIETVFAEDLLALVRFGSDKFALISRLPPPHCTERLEQVAIHFQQAATFPISFRSATCRLAQGVSVENLLDQAEHALRSAKKAQRQTP